MLERLLSILKDWPWQIKDPFGPLVFFHVHLVLFVISELLGIIILNTFY